MKTNLLKCVSLSILGFITAINLIAQPQASIYTDVSNSIVYDGVFVKNAGLINYQLGKYNTEAGFQFEINNPNHIFLTGFELKFSRNFRAGNFPFTLQSFYLVSPSSSLIRETNWGMVSNIESRHVKMSIGTNFRTFAFTRDAIRNYDIQSGMKTHELWNIIYSFSYFIKPSNHPWNTAISVTNLDNFTIERETNPILSLQALLRINSTLKGFVEVRCKGNAPLNLNMNYLGFAFRAGLIINM